MINPKKLSEAQLLQIIIDRENDSKKLSEEIHLLNVEKKLSENVIDELREVNLKFRTQASLANILQLSVKEIDIGDLFLKILEELLSIPWLGFLSKGTVFIKNKDGDLERIAQKNQSKLLIEKCSFVKSGQCISGKALEQKKPLFYNYLSNKNDFRPDVKQENGHYVFPLIWNDEVLGILNLCVSYEHKKKDFEVEFLKTTSIVLANIIKHKQTQDKSIKQAKDQDILNQKLFAQNLEIDQQRIEIQKIVTNLEKANTEISQQKVIIEKNHKNITDSINYARDLQNGLLPSKEKIDSILKDYFILFKSKDIVSGDFYFINKVENHLLIVAADCTGHGVYGALLTVLGITYLSEIINSRKDRTPAMVLESLRDRIKKIFRDFGYDSYNGMDMSFCAIDINTNILQYAGANNPIFIIRDNELHEYLPTKSPIGLYPKEREFVNQEIQLIKNDVLYMFSDGYWDQFNEFDVIKFSKARFKKLLLEIHNKPMDEQKEILVLKHNEWKGDTPQIDDILVIGIHWQ